MPSGENIRVAVRVRPFNEREKSRQANLIVSMEGKVTTLLNPDKPTSAPHKFAYDYSYWSHSGFTQLPNGYCEPQDDKYVDQIKVFQDLGMGMLENAWQGYNCSIFAYGQTGSGKSYSIMGHGANQGIVPRTCEELFTQIGQKKEAGVNFEVTFSMLEIYNEQVRDLLNKKKSPAGGLRVKESPGRGFYVEGLTVVPVGNFQDIRLRMSEGERQRTIAATKMNETSSRAHTIVILNFAQNIIQRKTTKLASISLVDLAGSRAHTIVTVKVVQNYVQKKTSKYADINLVDLAGSERAKQTEATGDRFEEAKNINKSLMTLGNVIKALCDKGSKSSSSHIPYRDAVLTKLLKNALGGNSKTVMIAAISPDSENFDQTLSTLRYADRAKSIKTVAKVNHEATDKLIKELIAEKERLLRELENAKAAGPGSHGAGYSQDDIQSMKEEQEKELLRYKDQMADAAKVWESRLSEARKEVEEVQARERRREKEESEVPHFSNLNEDPALNGKLRHLCPARETLVGNGKDGTKPGIILNGPRIAKEHAVVKNKGGKVELCPQQGLVLHNGQELTASMVLQHQDRVRFGSNNLFVFTHPLEASKLLRKGKQLREITYEYAISEITKNSGLDIDHEGALLQQEVMSLYELVQNVNAMAEDMDKPASLTIALVSAEARGLDHGPSQVFLRLEDLTTGNLFYWSKERFLNRQVLMQEMYQEYEETDTVPDVSQEKDPFWEPPDSPVIVGVVSVPLKYLSHMLEFQEEPLTALDYQAKQCGFLMVDLIPCDKHGDEEVDLCVDDPMDLVNHSVSFKIKVHKAMNLPERFSKTWCRYRFYNDTDWVETGKGDGKNPSYNHQKLVHFSRRYVDHKLIDYLREKSLAIEIWGQQRDQVVAGSRDDTRSRIREEVEKWRSRAMDAEQKLEKIEQIVDGMPSSSEARKIQRILSE